MNRILQVVGHRVLGFFAEAGTIFILNWKVFRAVRYATKDWHLILHQMVHIGIYSLPLVSVVGVFTGAVAAWQAAYQFEGYYHIPVTAFLGAATTNAIFIELGPVLTGIVIAGRVGASIAAELSTMKVTEQIDALQSLAISPIRYLAAPRVIASLLILPVLVVLADAIATLGAYLVSVMFLDVTTHAFFSSAQRFFELRNIFAGMVKVCVFGATTALVGCHIGFTASGGAEGVGRSTIRAFVLSSALILVSNYVLAVILF